MNHDRRTPPLPPHNIITNGHREIKNRRPKSSVKQKLHHSLNRTRLEAQVWKISSQPHRIPASDLERRRPWSDSVKSGEPAAVEQERLRALPHTATTTAPLANRMREEIYGLHANRDNTGGGSMGKKGNFSIKIVYLMGEGWL